MDKRHQDLIKLRTYTENIEKEVTLLLQNLQWGLNVSEKKAMVTCKHDSNHRIPLDSKEYHETQCHLKKLGYVKEHILLPEPVDPNATTLVKFSKLEISEIINRAAAADPLFKRGVGCGGPGPLSVERLQQAHSADERRAIHEAVVRSAPSCHDLAELELLSSDDGKKSGKKSRLEILAELRDMKRRRAKYRVPPKTRNYSDVLRDVIRAQMESYGEATRTVIKTEYAPSRYDSQKEVNSNPDTHDVIVKPERYSPEGCSPEGNNSNRNSYRAKSRERRYDTERRGQYKDYSSRDSRNYETSLKRYHSRDRTQKNYYSTERSREKRHNDGEIRYKDRSRERSENYDGKRQREYLSSDRSRDKIHDGNRYNEHHSSRERNSCHEASPMKLIEREIVIKQERVTDQSGHKHDYDLEDSRNHRRRDSAKLYSKNKSDQTYYDSRKTHQQRYSPDKKRQGRMSPQRDSYHKGNNTKSYNKRSENDRRDHKRRYEEDKYSSGHDKEYYSAKRRREFSGVAIKQERESP